MHIYGEGNISDVYCRNHKNYRKGRGSGVKRLRRRKKLFSSHLAVVNVNLSVYRGNRFICRFDAISRLDQNGEYLGNSRSSVQPTNFIPYFSTLVLVRWSYNSHNSRSGPTFEIGTLMGRTLNYKMVATDDF